MQTLEGPALDEGTTSDNFTMSPATLGQCDSRVQVCLEDLAEQQAAAAWLLQAGRISRHNIQHLAQVSQVLLRASLQQRRRLQLSGLLDCQGAHCCQPACWLACWVLPPDPRKGSCG